MENPSEGFRLAVLSHLGYQSETHVAWNIKHPASHRGHHLRGS
jgi:sterol desaturase/sphingolipid hydroxylase (fatty acid hydroxylase superfamily)